MLWHTYFHEIVGFAQGPPHGIWLSTSVCEVRRSELFQRRLVIHDQVDVIPEQRGHGNAKHDGDEEQKEDVEFSCLMEERYYSLITHICFWRQLSIQARFHN